MFGILFRGLPLLALLVSLFLVWVCHVEDCTWGDAYKSDDDEIGGWNL
jgi:hypothetical protein